VRTIERAIDRWIEGRADVVREVTGIIGSIAVGG